MKYRTESEQKYKKYKNKLTHIHRSAERQYYSDKLYQYKNDLKKTWNVLNEITKRKNNKSIEETTIVHNGKSISDKSEIANCFNNFFVNIGPSLASKIKSSSNKSFSDFMKPNICNSFFLQPTCEEEIVNITSMFKSKKSCGYDNVSMWLVKAVIQYIKVPLTHICNISLQSGLFPDKMKLAKVVPLFKSGDRKEISNYRPVSVLPQFSKILEKLYYKRLVKFVSDNNIIYGGQYGFQENLSTNLALMQLVEDLSYNIDIGNITTGVFIDLKKAFDTINHSILLKKLYVYGIRGIALDWINSYLSNRSQYVVYNGVNSESKFISCGVPQGSILGPLLFLLYINDLPNVSNKLKFILFADDTNVFFSSKDVDDINKTMKSELNMMSIWFKVNKLSLNLSKTNFMMFQNNVHSVNCKIVVDGIEVSRVKSTKFLGVYIDEKLNWSVHVNDICKKISKNNGVLYKVKHILQSEYLYTLYCSLVLPYLNYACEIWGNNYESRLHNVIILQKKAIRIVAKAGYIDHTSPLFKRFNCLKFVDIVKLNTLLIVYKARNNILPYNIQNMFSPSTSVHSHNTRSSSKGNFSVKFCKTKLRSMSISIIGVKLWNQLDSRFLNATSLSSFRMNLKRFYISSY